MLLFKRHFWLRSSKIGPIYKKLNMTFERVPDLLDNSSQIKFRAQEIPIKNGFECIVFCL